MLTAKEVRAIMPDKETVINNNVEQICKVIVGIAKQGYTSGVYDELCPYKRETLQRLKELGFKVTNDSVNGLVIDWSDDNDRT